MGIMEMATWACTTYDTAVLDAAEASNANDTVIQNAATAVAQNDIAQEALQEVIELLSSSSEGLIVIHRRYRYTASEGQVTFGGLDDDNVYMYIQPQNVRVFVNGTLRSDIDNLDASSVDLTTGVSAGDLVEIVSKFLYALAEDGSLIEYPMSDDLTISNEQYLASIPSGSEVLVNSTPALTPSATGYVKYYWDNQSWMYYIDPADGTVVEVERIIPEDDRYFEGNYENLASDHMHLFTTASRLSAADIAAIENDYNLLWDLLLGEGTLPSGITLNDIRAYYPMTEGNRAEYGAVRNFLWEPEDQKIVFYTGPGQGENSMYINAVLDGEYYFDGVLKVGTGSGQAIANQPNSRHEIYDPNHVITSITGTRWFGYCPDFTGSYNLESVELNGFANDGMVGPYPNVDGCTSLTHLDLHRNYFDGNLDSIMTRDSLVYLSLYLNRSSSGVFPSLENLPNLETLVVSYNYWSQEFPDISAHPSLKRLQANNSYFNGTPPSLNPTLEYWNFSRSKLTGSLPDMTPAIQEFYAHSMNGITGWGSFTGAVNLRVFQAYNCNISSELPPSLNDCVLLEDFTVYGNNITGSHPSSLNLPNLKIYSIGGSSGMTPSPLTDFSGCTSLETMSAESTSISGGVTDAMIPVSIKTLRINRSDYYDGDLLNTNLLVNLVTFDFSYNPNAVVTPRDFDFSNNPKLNYFRTQSTPMPGCTLSNFNSCQNLVYLYIDNSGFGGNMPDMDQSKMNMLYASGNQFVNSTLPALRVGQRYWSVGNNLMTYALSELEVYPDLEVIDVNQNLHTSNLPSFPATSNVVTFNAYANVSASKGDGITGSIPDMALEKLTDYKVHQNNIGPNLGDVSLCPNLANLWAHENNISTYTGTAIPTKLTSLQLRDNALTQNAVDTLLQQCVESVEAIGYDYKDTTTTTSAYTVGEIIIDTSNGKWYQCKLDSAPGTLLTNKTYFTYKGVLRTMDITLDGGTNASPTDGTLNQHYTQLLAYGSAVTIN